MAITLLTAQWRTADVCTSCSNPLGRFARPLCVLFRTLLAFDKLFRCSILAAQRKGLVKHINFRKRERVSMNFMEPDFDGTLTSHACPERKTRCLGYQG